MSDTPQICPAPDPKPIWETPARLRLLNWFEDYEPLRQMYRAALRNLFGPEYPVHTKVVCYCAREITSNLAWFVLGETPSWVDYKGRTNKICKRWPQDIKQDITPDTAGPGDRRISSEAYDAVEALVREHQRNGETKGRSIRNAFAKIAPDMHHRRREELKRQWMCLDGDFNKNLHTLPGNSYLLGAKAARDSMSIVERILLELIGQQPMISQLEALDVALREANRRTS